MPATESPALKHDASSVDWHAASPDQIKAEIARTRAHMDERLSDLGRKIRPRINPKWVQIPLASLFALATGFIIFRAVRPKSKLAAWSRKSHPSARVQRLKIKSAGMFDYIHALRLLSTIVRKGKPAVFIVEPHGK
jgi:hypothetical protein